MQHRRESDTGATSRTQSADTTLRCPGCGFAPSGWSQARTLQADLTIVWLTAENGGARESRFCRACAPHLSGEIGCAVCADGPLLAGEFSDAMLSGWLTERGWHRNGDHREGWLCPHCAPLIG
jgi:hypothetical protein